MTDYLNRVSAMAKELKKPPMEFMKANGKMELNVVKA